MKKGLNLLVDGILIIYKVVKHIVNALSYGLKNLLMCGFSTL